MAYKDKEKQKAYSAAWKAANKEKVDANNAAWRAANKEKKAAYYAANREKLSELNRKWHEANKEKMTAHYRFKKTGVTQEQYDGAYLKQKGICAICSNECSRGYRLAADHCHTTGVFRGLLCGSCNLGLGKFKDNTDLLTKAIGYLNDTKNV
jgi:hypothetical protein